jgi:hypothetical protein
LAANLGGIVGRKVRLAAAKFGYNQLDKYLTEKFPKGWDALCHAAKGWKTVTAILILNWPDIERWVIHITQLLGYNPAPGVVTAYAAKLLLGVALLDKVFKYWLSFEGLDQDLALEPPPLEPPDKTIPLMEFPKPEDVVEKPKEL